ncbi:MAG: HEAT repeat domain-containing protein [Lentisphaerae bacterium]|jgi:hypothetical protein|nr:HEAT repeat domain-containing protein [Lentisphaerota bacterium]MBT5612049.1 HEAT repeat domain-containing protein [Lentisphaerota bacterium]MBT7842040.1 HEAT repeat domain-containing protein [Lentisphaerota bacterium]
MSDQWTKVDSARTVAFTFLLLLCFWPRTTVCQEREHPLQEALDEAKTLATTPDKLQEAVDAYRFVVETQLEGQELFETAIREIVECYEKAGKPEEAIRFLVDVAQRQEKAGKDKALRETFGKLRIKHRELMAKVLAEMQGNSGKTQRTPSAAPSKELSQAILQREDPELRGEALGRLRELLAEGTSDSEKRTALSTLRAAQSAKFDRGPFRVLVLPLLKSEDARIRSAAVRCLAGLSPRPEDISVLAPLADDSSTHVRRQVGGALIQIGEGKQGETVIPALTKLLKDSDSKVIVNTIRSMWGQYSSPAFDELLIELSNHPKYHGYTIYHGLSTMRRKSVPVCRRLVRELAEPDWNNSGRAAWGLTYGVTDSAKSLVEEGLLEALPEETNGYTRNQEFRALRQVATEKSRPYLVSVLESEAETDDAKERAREILRELDGK